MEPLYGTLIVAAVGVLVQIMAAWGTYNYFTGKAEERMKNLEAEAAHMKQAREQQWAAIRKQGEDIAYLRGQAAALGKGKGAGA